jgi:hypothetical protein
MLELATLVDYEVGNGVAVLTPDRPRARQRSGGSDFWRPARQLVGLPRNGGRSSLAGW